MAAKAGDRMNHLAGAQIDDFNSLLVLAGNKQALAFEVYGRMIEISFHIREGYGLNQSQRRVVRLCCDCRCNGQEEEHLCNSSKSHQNCLCSIWRQRST